MTPTTRSEELLNTLQCEIVMWDWKDDVPFESIQEFVLEGYIHMMLVDTYADHHALVFTKENVHLDEANFIYENECRKRFGFEEKEDG